LEDASTTTWENARDVARILVERGVTRVALVTSAYHMPRASLAFARAGVVFVPAPTGFLAEAAPWRVGDLLPSFVALRESFLALTEYAGALLYSVRR
jgi:uncharacterized SAM-binding protein YcdF (DUF218 family)